MPKILILLLRQFFMTVMFISIKNMHAVVKTTKNMIKLYSSITILKIFSEQMFKHETTNESIIVP